MICQTGEEKSFYMLRVYQIYKTDKNCSNLNLQLSIDVVKEE